MTTESTPLVESLTPREEEVLERLRRGLTNRQIARELDISADGVKFHVSAILGKLGVRSRHEAAYWPEPAPWWAGGLAPLVFWWRRTVPSAGGTLSTTTNVIAGGVLFAAVAGLALLAFLVLGSRGSAEPVEVVELTLEPAVAFARALDNLRAADSYRMELTGSDAAGISPQLLMRLDYQAPDRYHAASDVYVVESAECSGVIMVAAGQTPPPTPTTTDECFDITSQADEFHVYEFLLLDGNMVWRRCETFDQGCRAYLPSFRNKEGPLLFGTSLGYTPELPLLILETVAEPTLSVPSEDGLVKLDALADTDLAFAHLIFEYGLMDFTDATPEEQCFTLPDGEEQCIQFGPDELRAMMENATNEEPDPQAAITVWISPQDLLIRRIEVDTAIVSPDYPRTIIEYSEYGNVTVDLPQ